MGNHEKTTVVGANLRRPLSFIFAIFVFSAIFVGSLVLIVVVNDDSTENQDIELEWWKKTLIYHVYVPSFYDSDGDGLGDLKGVQLKLDYIQSLGVDSVWLSPFYEFGGIDMGNDVVNHTKVDPRFGTEDDLTELLQDLERRGMRVIIDLILNHMSNVSDPFLLSLNTSRGPDHDLFTWRHPKLSSDDGELIPPNNWRSATNHSAWTYHDEKKMFYYHSFLPEMPDLNLHSSKVRRAIKDTMAYWLSRKPVSGFHISNFNILFEEFGEDDNLITTNVTASIDFLEELYATANETKQDNLDILFLLEIYEGDNVKQSDVTLLPSIRNSTNGVGEVSFSFGGDIPWRNNSVSGSSLETVIRTYLKSGGGRNSFPCWEMNDHDSVLGPGENDFGRIPKVITDNVLMATMLLPGTAIVYYGDEIGMANTTEISFEDTRDPYALPPYATEADYRLKSRDPFRTPMQWDASENAGFSANSSVKPWLPIAKDHDVVNVESETQRRNNGSQLQLFQTLTTLRNHKAIYDGDLFFPHHGPDTFSFMRKDKTDGTSFLVVLNVGLANGNVIGETFDYTSVMPGIKSKGYVVATSTLQPGTELLSAGHQIHLKNLTLLPQEGIVILIDYD